MDSLNFDYAQYTRKYYIVAADGCSGFVISASTKDQSTDSVLNFLII